LKTIDVWANDTFNHLAHEVYQFIIDNTNPSIHFVFPTDDDNSVVNRDWTYVNVSVSDASNTTAFIDFNHTLVGWWRFNNETGENLTLFKDWSSYGNDGTSMGMNHPTLVSGKFGSALSFDGVDDFVDCGNDASLNITGDITIEAWIYPVEIKNEMVVGKDNSYCF